MARQRMVTRTVSGTEAEVKIISISTDDITTIKHTLGGEFVDNDKLLKALKKAIETEDIKVLKVVSTTKIDKCYGMLETDFIKLAKELDPETRKALETETETETETTEVTPETDAPVEKKGKRGNK